jgi:Lsr2
MSRIANTPTMTTLQPRPLKEATMARRAVVQLVDDLDDTVIENDDGQIVRFGLDGTGYEIDLTNEHADELRGALARYVEAARKTGGDRPARARSTGRSRSTKSDVSPVAVRQWAKSKGIEVSARGRIPQSVVDQFKAGGD